MADEREAKRARRAKLTLLPRSHFEADKPEAGSERQPTVVVPPKRQAIVVPPREKLVPETTVEWITGLSATDFWCVVRHDETFKAVFQGAKSACATIFRISTKMDEFLLPWEDEQNAHARNQVSLGLAQVAKVTSERYTGLVAVGCASQKVLRDRAAAVSLVCAAHAQKGLPEQELRHYGDEELLLLARAAKRRYGRKVEEVTTIVPPALPGGDQPPPAAPALGNGESSTSDNAKSLVLVEEALDLCKAAGAIADSPTKDLQLRHTLTECREEMDAYRLELRWTRKEAKRSQQSEADAKIESQAQAATIADLQDRLHASEKMVKQMDQQMDIRLGEKEITLWQSWRQEGYEEAEEQLQSRYALEEAVLQKECAAAQDEASALRERLSAEVAEARVLSAQVAEARVQSRSEGAAAMRWQKVATSRLGSDASAIDALRAELSEAQENELHWQQEHAQRVVQMIEERKKHCKELTMEEYVAAELREQAPSTSSQAPCDKPAPAPSTSSQAPCDKPATAPSASTRAPCDKPVMAPPPGRWTPVPKGSAEALSAAPEAPCEKPAAAPTAALRAPHDKPAVVPRPNGWRAPVPKGSVAGMLTPRPAFQRRDGKQPQPLLSEVKSEN